LSRYKIVPTEAGLSGSANLLAVRNKDLQEQLAQEEQLGQAREAELLRMKQLVAGLKVEGAGGARS
jgi:hypothetical protein